MWSIIVETAGILNDSAVYLLFGFALSGALHVLLRRAQWVSRALAGTGTKSVVLAALFGAPLPLCSCSVIPAGLTLRREGASKGATASFLISVPETDIVSILLTYGLLGPVITVFRPLAAVVTAIVTGTLINLIERLGRGDASATGGDDDACGENCPNDEHEPDRGAIPAALTYGFVRFFDDIIVSLLIGIVLGGAITALLPSLGIERLAGNTWLTMLAMLVIGIPMYVCATASTPIAAGLIVAGVSPGAALVFLLAGPATNMASLIVLYKYLGRTTLIVYLACIAVISVLMGVWLDALVTAPSISRFWDPARIAESPPGAIKIGGSIVLGVLSYLSLRRVGAFDRALAWVNRATGLASTPRAVKTAGAVLLVVGYAGSGLFIVEPGERAAETRFGRMVRSDLGPGLHYRWPYPIGGIARESVTAVRRIELGFRGETGESAAATLAEPDEVLVGESWMLTGNEDIVAVTWVVQYRIADSQSGFLDYVYGVADQQRLVRGAAESAVRQIVGRRNIDTLLTTERQAVEAAVVERLGGLLAEYRAGVRIMGVHLQDVHAPPGVHAAFRDVASAAEDKAKEVNIAEEYAERVVREASGDAVTQVLSAEGHATELVQLAAGKSEAFGERLAAYRTGQAVTRLRLYFESLDQWLPSLTKYINLLGDQGAELDLWLINADRGGAVPVPPAIRPGKQP